MRTCTYDAGPANIDSLVAAFGSEGADDKLLQMPGIRDAFLLVNRTRGKAVTVTLWDSEDSVTASTAGASQMRQEAAGAAGGNVESLEVYEVALHLADATPARRGGASRAASVPEPVLFLGGPILAPEQQYADLLGILGERVSSLCTDYEVFREEGRPVAGFRQINSPARVRRRGMPSQPKSKPSREQPMRGVGRLPHGRILGREITGPCARSRTPGADKEPGVDRTWRDRPRTPRSPRPGVRGLGEDDALPGDEAMKRFAGQVLGPGAGIPPHSSRRPGAVGATAPGTAHRLREGLFRL